MLYNIVLTKKGQHYLAQVKEWPEVKAIKPTRQGAIQLVKQRLVNYLTQQVEVIQVEINLPTPKAEVTNPTFDDFLAEIRHYRQEMKPIDVPQLEFMRLSLPERRVLMAQQAAQMATYYQQATHERQDWQAGDFEDGY